jgi:hypothetical protein
LRGLKACRFLITGAVPLFQIARPFVERCSHVDKHRVQGRIRVESRDLAQVGGAFS